MKHPNLRFSIVRAATLLVFLCVCLSVIFYALGFFELPYIRRPDLPGTEDTSVFRPETTGAPGEESETFPPESTETPGTAPATAPETTEMPDLPPETAPAYSHTARELLADGYRVSYADWNENMVLAPIFSSAQLPEEYSIGSEKQIQVRQEIRYDDGGIQFESINDEIVLRSGVELYMGYILVDIGIADATSPFPSFDDAGNRTDRPMISGQPALNVYDATGKLIGTYIASFIVPAYTRDTADRALFRLGNAYYYIDDATGDFVLSDYDDARDNRGLYFDYNPAYGRSDSSIAKWSNYETVRLAYTIDTYYYYARFAIDWRIARALYMKYPEYAELVAKQTAPGKYYNHPFAVRLSVEQALLRAEGWTPDMATSTAEETTSPAPEPPETVPDTAALAPEPVTPSEITEPVWLSPEETETPAAPEGTEPVSEPVSEPVTESAAEPVTEPGTEPAGSDTEPTIEPETEPAAGSDTEPTTEPETEPETEPVTEPVTEPAVTEAPHEIADVFMDFDAYRFIYATKKPAVNPDYHSERTYSLSVYLDQRITWDSQYKYAKAFNFSEGRAVTFDDNNIMRVINTGAGSAVYLNSTYLNDEIKEYVRQYYTEPFRKDVQSLGHYYYDEGLLRVRFIEIADYMPTIYITDYDKLIDQNGKEYPIPAGFHLCSYASGVLVLERNGLYGCYHKDGYWIAQPVYAAAEPFVEGLCVLTRTDGAKGMIDTRGNTVIPFRYNEITNASTGVIACFRKDEGWTVFGKFEK